jgi:hypothetical protein
MLTIEQKLRLKMAVRVPADYTKENKELDRVIAQIKSESPSLYWTPDTLILRKFFNRPKYPIPCQSWKHD